MKSFRLCVLIILLFALNSCTLDYSNKKITIKFVTNSEQEIEPIKVTKGSIVTLITPYNEGHSFEGWFKNLDNPLSMVSNIYKADRNITLYAGWKVNKYTISFNTLGHNPIDAITDDYGSELNLPTPQKFDPDYDFVGWYEDSNLTIPFVLNKIPSRNYTLYAKWATNKTIITISFYENRIMNYFLKNPIDNVIIKFITPTFNYSYGDSDILLVRSQDVIKNHQAFVNLNNSIVNKLINNAPNKFYYNINDNYQYIPLYYNGMNFSWNKSFLMAFGIDLTDADGDNLPDTIDTFEKIFNITKTWQNLPPTRPSYKGRLIHTFFPMSLTEVWSGYSSLTAGGWNIFSTNDPLKPGFDDIKFLEGLNFIAEAADNYLSTTTNEQLMQVLRKGNDMGWNWDNFLHDEFSPTGLIGTWMNYKSAEVPNGADYQFSRMPTWKGNQLTPFASTYGFAINKFSSNIEISQQVLDILYSENFMQYLIDNSNIIPVFKDDLEFNIVYKNEKTAQRVKAFLSSAHEPNLILPKNPNRNAMDAVYYCNDSQLKEILIKAWDEASLYKGSARSNWLLSLSQRHHQIAQKCLTEMNVAP